MERKIGSQAALQIIFLPTGTETRSSIGFMYRTQQRADYLELVVIHT